MSNLEGSHSEYFDELCALAASGQVSEQEFVELRDHMQHCAHCRSALTDFTDLLHHKLPLADPDPLSSSRLTGAFSENSSYRERFLTRARKQGLAVSDKPLGNTTARSRWRVWFLHGPAYAHVAICAMALLLVIVGILGYSLRQSNARYRTLAAELSAMGRQIIRQSSSDHSSERASSLDQAPTSPAPTSSKTDAELVKARENYVAAETLAQARQEQLQAAAVELQASRARFEEASNSQKQLLSELSESKQVVARVNGELQNLRDSRSKDSMTIATQDLEIRQLSEKLTEQTESLEREKTLLAAGRDIHDLMGARNLHIVDVLDVDSKGKDRKAFGRVFYTEETSLIIYAFDLGDRTTTRRNASFQVWGARGAANPAESLGIFYVDDQKQNRWVLKFEDPRILAEIDSVFVTVEPPGGSAKPTGRKFLYAYLKANPNHP
jgi:hypothetical protein